MKNRLLAALLILVSSDVLAFDCIVLVTNEYGSSFLENKCNRIIQPISFCWESQASDCSCFHGGGCGAGPIYPGKKEVISGPGTEGKTQIKYSWCFYDEWKAGRCETEKFRPY